MIFTEKVHRVYYEMYWASSSYPGHTCSTHPLPIDSVCHFALFSVGHCFVSTSIYCFWFGIFKLFLYQADLSQWFSSLELNDFLAFSRRNTYARLQTYFSIYVFKTRNSMTNYHSHACRRSNLTSVYWNFPIPIIERDLSTFLQRSSLYLLFMWKKNPSLFFKKTKYCFLSPW
jgi:hypothetical protein